jgi:hypothetical protein
MPREPNIRMMKIERGARSSPIRSYFHQLAARVFDLRVASAHLLIPSAHADGTDFS